jgi:hypothetical protein
MLVHVKSTFKIGTYTEGTPISGPYRSFSVTVDGRPATVSFVDPNTMEAQATIEVSDELRRKLESDASDYDSWPSTLRAEAYAFAFLPDAAFIRVHEVLKYALRSYSLKERPRPENWEWSLDGTAWTALTPTTTRRTARSWMPSLFDKKLHAKLQSFLDNERRPLLDAFRHWHRAEREKNPRYAWIDATIAAELGIKDFLMQFKPDWTTLLTYVPSPPLHILYGKVLESLTGEQSPRLKQLREGAEQRNLLIHRPNQSVTEEDMDSYLFDVEVALFHLLALLYPDDELVRDEYQLCLKPPKFFPVKTSFEQKEE